MALGNTNSSYGSIAKTLHWLTALLILSAIPLGKFAHDLAVRIQDPLIETTQGDLDRVTMMFSLHKTIGVAVFFVALARILWALIQPHPGLLNAEKRAEAMAAQIVHWLLYGALVIVPLSGWIHHAASTGFAPIWWPFGDSLPFVPKDAHLSEQVGQIHGFATKVLIVSLLLHIAGALKHHVTDKDATLRRMLPFGGTAETPPQGGKSALPQIAASVIWAGVIAAGMTLSSQTQAPAQTETASDLPAEATGNWQVTEGTLGLTIQQMGSPVSGQFANWTADITFDDTVTEGLAGKVTVTIDIASLSLGTVTDQAMGADFFDQPQFPTATFSGEITRAGDSYTAAGPLMVKGQSVPVTLPFELTLNGDTADMTAKLVLDRQDFAIGASMPDESSLGFGVEIAVQLTASKR